MSEPIPFEIEFPSLGEHIRRIVSGEHRVRGFTVEAAASAFRLHSGKRMVFVHSGRNDPCPCGSGVKFKKCHGR